MMPTNRGPLWLWPDRSEQRGWRRARGWRRRDPGCRLKRLFCIIEHAGPRTRWTQLRHGSRSPFVQLRTLALSCGTYWRLVGDGLSGALAPCAWTGPGLQTLCRRLGAPPSTGFSKVWPGSPICAVRQACCARRTVRLVVEALVARAHASFAGRSS